MPTYAKGTDVSVSRSREEIERSLSRFGATAFNYGWMNGAAAIQFVLGNRQIRFVMKLPKKTESRFIEKKFYNRTKKTTPDEQEKLWEAECRQYWRALALLVKAKLAAVEAGITDFEEEFLAHVVVPTADGSTTIGTWLRPQIEGAYKTGALPPLLPPGIAQEE